MSERFCELIRERYACRNFSDKPIEKDLVYAILEDAINAPSACNSQPWRVFVTCTPEENAKMRKCLQEDGKNAFLDNAQAFIAVYNTDDITLKASVAAKFPSSHFVKYDIGEFIAYITLAAKDRGIDSCIIGWLNNAKINETFALNGNCDIVVALGYGKEAPRVKSRLPLSTVVLNFKD